MRVQTFKLTVAGVQVLASSFVLHINLGQTDVVLGCLQLEVKSPVNTIEDIWLERKSQIDYSPSKAQRSELVIWDIFTFQQGHGTPLQRYGAY